MNNPEPQVPEACVIEVKHLWFVSLFEPSDPMKTGNASYRVSFPWQDLMGRPAEIFTDKIEYAKRDRYGLVSLAVSRQPRVYSSTGRILDMEKLKADAYGIGYSPDRAMSGVKAELHLDFFLSNRGRNAGKIIPTLLGVRFDPTSIKLPKFGELVEHPMLIAAPVEED